MGHFLKFKLYKRFLVTRYLMNLRTRAQTSKIAEKERKTSPKPINRQKKVISLITVRIPTDLNLSGES